MSQAQQNLDVVELQQALDFFKEMGFSDEYVELLEQDLRTGEQRFARTILENELK